MLTYLSSCGRLRSFSMAIQLGYLFVGICFLYSPTSGYPYGKIPNLSFLSEDKKWMCPPVPSSECFKTEIDVNCLRHQDCAGHKMCCMYACSYDCVIPYPTLYIRNLIDVAYTNSGETTQKQAVTFRNRSPESYASSGEAVLEDTRAQATEELYPLKELAPRNTSKELSPLKETEPLPKKTFPEEKHKILPPPKVGSERITLHPYPPHKIGSLQKVIKKPIPLKKAVPSKVTKNLSSPKKTNKNHPPLKVVPKKIKKPSPNKPIYRKTTAKPSPVKKVIPKKTNKNPRQKTVSKKITKNPPSSKKLPSPKVIKKTPSRKIPSANKNSKKSSPQKVIPKKISKENRLSKKVPSKKVIKKPQPSRKLTAYKTVKKTSPPKKANKIVSKKINKKASPSKHGPAPKTNKKPPPVKKIFPQKVNKIVPKKIPIKISPPKNIPPLKVINKPVPSGKVVPRKTNKTVSSIDKFPHKETTKPENPVPLTTESLLVQSLNHTPFGNNIYEISKESFDDHKHDLTLDFDDDRMMAKASKTTTLGIYTRNILQENYTSNSPSVSHNHGVTSRIIFYRDLQGSNTSLEGSIGERKTAFSPKVTSKNTVDKMKSILNLQQNDLEASYERLHFRNALEPNASKGDNNLSEESHVSNMTAPSVENIQCSPAELADKMINVLLIDVAESVDVSSKKFWSESASQRAKQSMNKKVNKDVPISPDVDESHKINFCQEECRRKQKLIIPYNNTKASEEISRRKREVRSYLEVRKQFGPKIEAKNNQKYIKVIKQIHPKFLAEISLQKYQNLHPLKAQKLNAENRQKYQVIQNPKAPKVTSELKQGYQLSQDAKELNMEAKKSIIKYPPISEKVMDENHQRIIFRHPAKSETIIFSQVPNNEILEENPKNAVFCQCPEILETQSSKEGVAKEIHHRSESNSNKTLNNDQKKLSLTHLNQFITRNITNASDSYILLVSEKILRLSMSDTNSNILNEGNFPRPKHIQNTSRSVLKIKNKIFPDKNHEVEIGSQKPKIILYRFSPEKDSVPKTDNLVSLHLEIQIPFHTKLQFSKNVSQSMLPKRKNTKCINIPLTLKSALLLSVHDAPIPNTVLLNISNSTELPEDYISDVLPIKGSFKLLLQNITLENDWDSSDGIFRSKPDYNGKMDKTNDLSYSVGPRNEDFSPPPPHSDSMSLVNKGEQKNIPELSRLREKRKLDHSDSYFFRRNLKETYPSERGRTVNYFIPAPQSDFVRHEALMIDTEQEPFHGTFILNKEPKLDNSNSYSGDGNLDSRNAAHIYRSNYRQRERNVTYSSISAPHSGSMKHESLMNDTKYKAFHGKPFHGTFILNKEPKLGNGNSYSGDGNLDSRNAADIYRSNYRQRERNVTYSSTPAPHSGFMKHESFMNDKKYKAFHGIFKLKKKQELDSNNNYSDGGNLDTTGATGMYHSSYYNREKNGTFSSTRAPQSGSVKHELFKNGKEYKNFHGMFKIKENIRTGNSNVM